MEVKKIVEGMTAPEVAQVIDENFNGLNAEKATVEAVADVQKNVNASDDNTGVLSYPVFDDTEPVEVGAVRRYEGLLYRAKVAGANYWDPEKWERVTLKQLEDEKLSDLASKVIKIEGIGTTSDGTTGVTASDQYFISSFNGKLYKSSNYTETSFTSIEIPYIDGMIIIYEKQILLVVKGETIVFMKDELEELSQIIEEEIKRAKDFESVLSYKGIKLVGFGSISAGTSGVTDNDQYFVSTYDGKLYKSANFVSESSFSAIQIPYIDGAVYVYNNELYIYNGSELISANKSINEELKSINEELKSINITLGSYFVKFEEGKFVDNIWTTSVGDVLDIVYTPSSSYRCAIIDVNEGEKYILNIVGGARGLAYAIIDEENILLAKSASLAELNDYVLIVPNKAVRLILNDNNSGGECYKMNRLDVVQEDLSAIKEKTDSLEKTVAFPLTEYTQAFIDDKSMTWNAKFEASYNTIEAATNKIKGMKCFAIWGESTNNTYTSVVLISNPNGIHNKNEVWPELNNKKATQINKKSIHPTFTGSNCQLGLMLNGELSILHNIEYDKPIQMDGVTEYRFGWSVDMNGITVLTPDGKSHRFLNADDGVNYYDYSGRYCCFEFFNNSNNRINSSHPRVKRIEVIDEDGFIIYDNFIRPNGLIGLTPAGFIWHQSSNGEGYYSY